MLSLLPRYLINFLALYLGCATCFWLRTRWDWSPILAAAALGVAATFVPVPSRFDQKRLQIVFCTGTFIGMSSAQIISGPRQIFEVSLLGAALCVLAEPYFKGLGGRMGFIAFLVTMLWLVKGAFA
jgi:hypothetical protein